MERLSVFFNLVFGWRDSESGFGAGYDISPEIKAFFQGWLGNDCPKFFPNEYDVTCSSSPNEYTPKKQIAESTDKVKKLSAFADKLEELATEIRTHIGEPKP